MAKSQVAFRIASIGLAGSLMSACGDKPAEYAPDNQPSAAITAQQVQPVTSPKADDETIAFPQKKFTYQELAETGNDVKCMVRFNALVKIGQIYEKTFYGKNAYLFAIANEEDGKIYINMAKGKISEADLERRSTAIVVEHMKTYPDTSQEDGTFRNSGKIFEKCGILMVGIKLIEDLKSKQAQPNPAPAPVPVETTQRPLTREEEILRTPVDQATIDVMKEPPSEETLRALRGASPSNGPN